MNSLNNIDNVDNVDNIDNIDNTDDKSRLVLTLRQNGVTDSRVLRGIESVPRGMFVSGIFRSKAYEDTALPIGADQTISQPSIVGKMTQALELTDRMKVLEIGTGSGYQSAVLAFLCRRLYTLERHQSLLQQAIKRFERLGIYNITALHGDGSFGWPEQAPFDRIMVTAAAGDVPVQLLEQLVVGGIMVVPVDSFYKNIQYLLKVTKTENGAETEEMGAVRFVPLVGGIVKNEQSF